MTCYSFVRNTAQVPATNTCSLHPKQTYQYYCENDGKLICSLCATDMHKGHAFTDLAEHAKVKRCELEAYLKKLKNELLLIKSEEKNTNKLIDEVNQRRATILQEIIKKADFLRNEIDIAMVKLTEALDSQQKVDETLLGNHKSKVKSSIEKLQQHIHQIESQISTTDAVMLKWISCNNVDTLFYQTFLTEMLSLGKPIDHKFASLAIDEKRMSRLIGRLHTVYFKDHECSATEFEGPVKLNSIIDFNRSIPNAKHVGTLFPVHGDLTWVGFQRPQILKQVSRNGREKISISVDFVFKDMIVNTYGDVMLTEDKGSKVWKVNCLGPRKEFFDASPFGTRCMCLAKNGDILLCLQAKGTDGKIVRLSPNGNVISEHSKNLKGEILFRNPDRVLQNVNDDIIVIDWNPKNVQKVVGLTSDLTTVKFTYCGLSNISGQKPFTPHGLANDKFGHIYITDHENKIIHIITPDGDYLSCINFKELETNWPRRIAVSSKNLLWIGCNNAITYTIDLKELGIHTH